MGAPIVSAIAGQVVGKVLGSAMGGNPEKKAAKAQAAETARLNAESAAVKLDTEQKRKAKAAQRPQTDVFLNQADAGGATLG